MKNSIPRKGGEESQMWCCGGSRTDCCAHTQGGLTKAPPLEIGASRVVGRGLHEKEQSRRSSCGSSCKKNSPACASWGSRDNPEMSPILFSASASDYGCCYCKALDHVLPRRQSICNSD